MPTPSNKDAKKPKRPKIDYEALHRLQLERYARLIDGAFDAAVREAVAIVVTLPKVTPSEEKPFTFADLPASKRRVSQMMDSLKQGIEGIIKGGIVAEWKLANNKHDDLVAQVFEDKAKRLPEDLKKRYLSNNDDALAAFLQRKVAGLNLSEKVWKYAEQFKAEIEMGLDVGIRSGLDAGELARSLQGFLREPTQLFRRVRDQHGVLQLSKRAAAYHPGQGVYRSSHKNARRLAVTETNIAYRTADHLRIQQLDFVVGIEIHLSGNHTLNGKPFLCMCDSLVGKYPKDFRFVGWHPHCRCYVTTILKTPEEMAQDIQRILDGEPIDSHSVNEVTDTPDGFKAWLKQNEENTARASHLPYFIKDNPRWTGVALKGKPSAPTAEERRTKTLERAKARHEARRSFDRRLILHQWEERQIVRRYADELPESLDEKTRLAIARNSREIERALGVTKGRPMSIDEADRQSANPRYTPKYIRDENGRYKDRWGRKLSLNPEYNERKAKPYSINCATCTPAYLLRTRGLPVVAKGNTRGSLVEAVMKGGWMRLFTNTDGSPIEIQSTQKWAEGKNYKAMSPKRYKEFFEESCKEPGIYYLGISWRRRGAHATILQRTADGRLLYIEPQIDNSDKDRTSLLSLIQGGTTRLSPYDGIFRIDDKLFNLEYISIFAKETD